MVKMTESVCDWYTYILISQCFSDYESGVPVQLWECLGQFPVAKIVGQFPEE